jgi:hypothetical protein
MGEIQPGDDRPIDLGLGDEPEGEGRRAGRRRAAQRDAGAAREATRSEDRVEGRKAGPDDPLDTGPRSVRGRGSELVVDIVRLGRQWHRGQRPDDSRSCRTPSRLEGRQSSRHVRGEADHRTVSIEHLF